MRSACFLFAALYASGAVLLPSSAGAQATPTPTAKQEAQTVAIGPGLFSLTEIAEILSTSDAPLRVSPRFGGQIGFVHLQNRSRTDARRLIARAFALVETPTKPPATGAAWENDPLTYRREAAWRDSFTSYLARQAERIWSDWMYLAGLEPEALSMEVEQRDKYSKTRSAFAENPDGGFTFDGRHRVLQAMADAGRAEIMKHGVIRGHSMLSPVAGVPLARLTSAALREGQAVYTTSVAGEPRKVTVSLRYNNGSYQYGIRFANVWQPVELDDYSIVTRFWGSVEQSAEPLLGQRAAQWLKDEEKASEPFLSSPQATLPFTLNPTLPSDSVGARVWQWSVAQKRDAISEVFPALDATEWNVDTIASTLHGRNALSAHEEDGALIVTSRLAFLARPQTHWENKALLTWVRDSVKEAKVSRSKEPFLFGLSDRVWPDVPLSRAISYSRMAWEDGRYACWDAAGIGTSYGAFWHVLPQTLDHAALFGALWERLPARKQATSDDKPVTVPLRDLGSRTVALVHKWYQARRTTGADDAAFRTYLEHVCLVMNPVSSPGGERLLHFRLALAPDAPVEIAGSYALEPTSLTVVPD